MLNHRVSCVALFLCSLAMPLAAHEKGDHLMGTIQSVEAGRLIVTAQSGNVPVDLDEKTEIQVGGKPATAKELIPGQRVVVHRQGGSGGKLTAALIKASAPPSIGWTSNRQPTASHARMHEEHQKHAADKRKELSQLQAAEARLCVGLSPEDRDMSPFEHVDDIAGVKVLKEKKVDGKRTSDSTTGVIVTFRAVPGLTAEWLKRVIDCHIARNEAVGNAEPLMPNCPLMPKGVTASVASAGSGFEVTVRSSDPEAAKEIVARGNRLAASLKK